MNSLFHLAFHVTNLTEAKDFYGRILGCQQGRETQTWVDFDFFGHQISLHLGEPFVTQNTGIVEGHKVPMPHFGAILQMPDWHKVITRLTAESISFEYGPSIRYEGESGEQATAFFRDPAGNPIELKGFNNIDGVFAQ